MLKKIALPLLFEKDPFRVLSKNMPVDKFRRNRANWALKKAP
jgi:hypothetical protein